MARIPLTLFEGLAMGDVRGFDGPSTPSASPPTLTVGAASLYRSLVNSNFQYAYDAATGNYEWIPGYPPAGVSEDLLRQIEAAVKTGWYMEPDGTWNKLVVPGGGPVRTAPIQIKGKVTGLSGLGWAALIGFGFFWWNSRKG